MKKLLFLALMAFAVSCKKEDPSDENNPNGSNPSDPCSGVTCLNGGYCVDGSCNCPDGYYGNFCENQLPAMSCTITKVSILNFPATDGGAGWDLTSGPDLYAAHGTGCDQGTTTYYQNAVNTSDYTWNVSWYIADPNATFKACIMDYDDFDSDDWMHTFMFIPQDYSDGWPSTFTITSASSQIKFWVTWNY